MWQPEHPPSQTVARRSRRAVAGRGAGLGTGGRAERGRSPWAARDFSKMAPVGQAETQRPQSVQARLAPQVAPSVAMRERNPCPMTPSAWAPSSSEQARTQRVQRMQRPGSRAKRAREASTGQRGISGPARTASSPVSLPSSWSSQRPLAAQNAHTWCPPAKSISATDLRCAAERRRVRGDAHPGARRGHAGGDRLLDPLDLHEADPAARDLREPVHVAERRERDATAVAGLEQGAAVGHRDLPAVDDQARRDRLHADHRMPPHRSTPRRVGGTGFPEAEPPAAHGNGSDSRSRRGPSGAPRTAGPGRARCRSGTSRPGHGRKAPR